MSPSTDDREGDAAPDGAHVPEQPSSQLRLIHLLAQVELRRDRAAAQMLAPLALSLSQWRVLLYLSVVANASMSEVADYVAIDRTSLTRAVDKLVVGQLVLRSEAPHDRRMTTLDLTPAGRRACEIGHARIIDHAEGLLDGLDEQDICRTTRVLETMLTRLIGQRAGARRVVDLI